MSDYIFFKFRDINNHLVDSLKNSVLYFALPAQLNDPFDCQVDIRKSARNAISKLSGQQKENLSKWVGSDGGLIIQEKVSNAGICSFSLELDNSPLWSHYADNHRGLCLTYEFPASFINDRSNEIIGIDLVEYEDSPLTDWFVENPPKDVPTDFHFAKEIIKKVFTIKSPCWEYEKEARIIRGKPGALEIPREYLRQVCFGLNTSKSDIAQIRQLFESSGYEVDYCKMERSQNDFGLKAVEYDDRFN